MTTSLLDFFTAWPELFRSGNGILLWSACLLWSSHCKGCLKEAQRACEHKAAAARVSARMANPPRRIGGGLVAAGRAGLFIPRIARPLLLILRTAVYLRMSPVAPR